MLERLPAIRDLAVLAGFAWVSGALACGSIDTHTELVGRGPSLTELAVETSADAGSSAVLVPSFSSDVHDYYVRCAAGTNALTFSMKASPGAESLLLQPARSGSSPQQTLAVQVKENEAVVAAATDGSVTTEYWVRCLPHDFPPMQMIVHVDVGAAPPGYYLVGTKATTRSMGYAMVLDGNGVPVWYVVDRVPFPDDMIDVDLVVDGGVSFIPSRTSPFELHEFNPVKTTFLAPAETALDNHELRRLPNGDYLAISNAVTTDVDLTGLNLPLPDGGVEALGPHSSVLNCNVVEFDAKGTVIWQWVGTDHLDPAKDTRFLTEASPAGTTADGGAPVDTFHCNAIDVDPKNGNLLVSARHLDSIFYIEKSTGKILWKMGGARYTKDEAAYVSVPDAFYRQHDARLMPGWSIPPCSRGAGQISMFDDETGKQGSARGVVYDVDVASGDVDAGCDGGSTGVAAVVWEYNAEENSSAEGSFRISSDGSRVIGWGSHGGGTVFSEVDIDKHDLLDFAFTEGTTSYRAVKVPLRALDLGAMRRTAGLPP